MSEEDYFKFKHNMKESLFDPVIGCQEDIECAFYLGISFSEARELYDPDGKRNK